MFGFYNMPLRHVQFGEGKIKGWNGKTVTVRFNHSDVNFWFPMAFDVGALSTMNEKDEELLQQIKSRWTAVFPAEKAEQCRANCDIIGEVQRLKSINAGDGEKADALQRLYSTWGHVYTEAEIGERIGVRVVTANAQQNPMRKIIMLISLVLAGIGAIFSFVSALVWSISDEMEMMRAITSEADGYLAMFIIFGIGGALATIGGAVCSFLRLPYRAKHLDFGLIVSGGSLMVGALVAQCVFAADFYAMYSVWALLGILFAAASATISGLTKFTSVFNSAK